MFSFRGLLDKEETLKLKYALENDEVIKAKKYRLNDDQDNKVLLSLWNHPRDDITGIVGRADKVAGTMEKV